MTASSDPQSSTGGAKIVMPPLDARAARPSAVRLRKGALLTLGLGAGALIAGALVWSLVLEPNLQTQAREAKVENREAEPRGPVRPSEKITAQPATYAHLAKLPEPRRLGKPRDEIDDPPPDIAPRRSTPDDKKPDPSAEARRSELFFSTSTPAAGPSVSAKPPDATDPSAPTRGRVESAGRQGDAAAYNNHRLTPPLSPYELKAGAVIPAVLITGVDTSRAGPAIAVVAENVFDSVAGLHLVVPQGSRLIGRHEGESRQGDRRAFLDWERLILPNGSSILLTQAQGVDAQGVVGVEGKVDRRLGRLAAASLLAGAITAVGQAAREQDDGASGWLGDAGDAASIAAAQVGGRLMDRELSLRPVVRLAPGARIRVLITRDLVLEPYRP